MSNQPAIHATISEPSSLPRYDWRQSYDWNYDHAPAPVELDVPPMPGAWNYCGLPVGSPLGISAGPLLNDRWILYYASLGFDVLTYKTVRSRYRASYPMPNLQPVAATRFDGREAALPSCGDATGSWAVSFGIPSRSPDVWRADVEATCRALPENKILSVSVVATPEPHWTIDDIADDFARCANWAIESGAHCIEANFSCPNVASADGQLYHQPEAAAVVAARLRSAVGSTPLLIKIGHVTDESAVTSLSQALAPYADALVMVNCIAATVLDEHQRPLFNGDRRGIAGEAIWEAVLDQVRLFSRVIHQHALKLQIVGGGGIANWQHVQAHLAAGSHAVQLAIAAMLDPLIGLRIRHSS
jgi:dihydroorotate dehydrogenase (NAD+) catalytic subunit